MDLRQEIAKVAYELFERDGRKHGKDKEHWTEAEKIVKARSVVKKDAPKVQAKAAPAPKPVVKKVAAPVKAVPVQAKPVVKVPVSGASKKPAKTSGKQFGK